MGHPPIQCSTGPFWAFDLDDAFELIAAAGFSDVELMVTRDRRTQEPDIPARLAAEHGLRIASVHGPFLAITKTVWGADPMGKIRRGIEMCKELGARSYIVHPPFLWERRYARWVTESSEEEARASGVETVVETMYPLWMAGRRMRGYRWLDPAALVTAAPMVALDTSHVTVARYDVLEAYRTLQPRLRHIHLSDNAGDGRDGHLELEQGILPIDRFLTEVRKTGYGGAISLELSVRRYIERKKDLVAMLKRSRTFVEDRLSGADRAPKGMPRRR